MRKIFTFFMVVMLALSGITAQAQVRRSAQRRANVDRSRYEHSRYSDVADIRLSREGTLEKELGSEKEKQVRLLIVDGYLNERDLSYIKKLCNRSRVCGADGKDVDNYIDIDLRNARVNNGGSYFTSSKRDVLTSNLFSHATHLRSIVLPNRVRSIEKNAFKACTHLEDVVLPAGLETIGQSAFEDCDQLINIYIPDGVQSVGNRAFAGCDRLRSIYIPESVTSIGDRAFENTALTDVYLPDRLETLGAAAFSGTSIKSLYLPKYVSINNGDLGTMSKLSEFVVDTDNRNYKVADGALYDYNGTKLLRMPMAARGDIYVADGTETIGAGAFQGCSAITNIELPSTVTTIGASAFSGCHNAAAIYVPDACTAIGKNAFMNSGIHEVILPTGITRIEENTFRGATSLSHVVLPHTLTYIGINAFYDCKSLGAINIPAGVTELPKSVFEGCKNLAVIELNDGLTTIGEYTFKKCNALTHIEMPPSLRTIGKNAFRECGLISISLNEGLLSLGDHAWSDHLLVELTNPSTVTPFGKKVAEKNKQLARITILATIPPSLDKVSNNKVQLFVPSQSIDAYQNANNWKNFKYINAQ